MIWLHKNIHNFQIRYGIKLSGARPVTPHICMLINSISIDYRLGTQVV